MIASECFMISMIALVSFLGVPGKSLKKLIMEAAARTIYIGDAAMRGDC